MKAWFRKGTKLCMKPAKQKGTWIVEAYVYPMRIEALALKALMHVCARG